MRTLLPLLVALPVMTSTAPHARACTPDLVIVNANVHTVDRGRPSAEAVAVCGEVIARVGSTEDVRRLAGPSTRIIDAGGRLLVPGFNDAHVHLIKGAEEIVGVDLRPARSEAELAARLRDHAARLPKGRWILGGYWDHEAWPSKALPTRQLLDAVTPGHPVFVQRLDGHMAVANSLALKLAGITRDVQTPDGGAIVREADGTPTGVFKDNAMDLVSRAIPPDTLEEVIEKARAALKHAASLGVTTIQDMTAGPLELRACQALRASGDLSARLYSIQNHGIDGLRAAGIATGFTHDLFTIPARQILDATAALTIVDGRIVHDAGVVGTAGPHH